MKMLMENWNNFVNEVRFRPRTLKQLGITVDALINKFAALNYNMFFSLPNHVKKKQYLEMVHLQKMN